MVYCSRYLGDEQAKQALLANVEGKTLTEPRVIKFRPGQRRQTWRRNCVAIGLASGFIEPLESTSIHLIQRGIIRLLQMFPRDGIRQSDIDEYNEQTNHEIEHIRDFIVLHYHVTRRQDTPFWRACRDMEIPDTLRHRIDLFRETGRVFRVPNELFAENSWIQVMLGQGIEPQQHHPVADLMGDEELSRFLDGIRSTVERTVAQLPAHQAYVEQYCKAPPMSAHAGLGQAWPTSTKSRSSRACRWPPSRASSIRAPRSATRPARKCWPRCASSATSRIPSRSRSPPAARNAVGVLVSELHGPFFGAMLSAIEQTLKAAGKFVLVAAGHSKRGAGARGDPLPRQPQLRRADRARRSGWPTNSWSITITTPRRSWS